MESTSNATHVPMQGATYWLTGLSGAGKSTLSEFIQKDIVNKLGDNKKFFILDGDVIRTGLNKGLGFSAEDRAENIRRIAEVSKLFNMAGIIVFVAFISPYAEARVKAQEVHGDKPFFECHISASLEVCEKRDVKGLYKKARAGEIKNFTGISDPYEEPANPALRINTGELSLEQCANMVYKHMEENNIMVKKDNKQVIDHLIREATEEENAKYKDLERLDIDIHQVQYLQTISEGWAHPLKGFMNEMQLLESMQMKTITDELGNPHLLSVPITQHITAEQKEKFEGKDVAITCSKLGHDHVLAVMKKCKTFENRKEEIFTRYFGTQSTKHPCVETIMAQGPFLISAEDTHFLRRIQFNDGLDQYRLTPREIHEEMEKRGADAVYGFQVRNPLHNGHVLLLNDTREQLIKVGYKNPILLLHPLGGWQKEDDVPLDYRMRQHQALIDDGTINKDHIVLAVWPSPMYYAGPTEVLWHASSRVGCGLTHFITGRDPAGMNHPEKDEPLYDVWHGQKLLVHEKRMLKGVDVLPFKVAAYHTSTKSMKFFTGANKEEFEFISGSRMRAAAKAGEMLPEGFMSPAGWAVLCEYYKSL